MRSSSASNSAQQQRQPAATPHMQRQTQATAAPVVAVPPPPPPPPVSAPALSLAVFHARALFARSDSRNHPAPPPAPAVAFGGVESLFRVLQSLSRDPSSGGHLPQMIAMMPAATPARDDGRVMVVSETWSSSLEQCQEQVSVGTKGNTAGKRGDTFLVCVLSRFVRIFCRSLASFVCSSLCVVQWLSPPFTSRSVSRAAAGPEQLECSRSVPQALEPSARAIRCPRTTATRGHVPQ